MGSKERPQLPIIKLRFVCHPLYFHVVTYVCLKSLKVEFRSTKTFENESFAVQNLLSPNTTHKAVIRHTIVRLLQQQDTGTATKYRQHVYVSTAMQRFNSQYLTSNKINNVSPSTPVPIASSPAPAFRRRFNNSNLNPTQVYHQSRYQWFRENRPPGDARRPAQEADPDCPHQ